MPKRKALTITSKSIEIKLGEKFNYPEMKEALAEADNDALEDLLKTLHSLDRNIVKLGQMVIEETMKRAAQLHLMNQADESVKH